MAISSITLARIAKLKKYGEDTLTCNLTTLLHIVSLYEV